jgi:hypothetical protein
MGFSLSKMILYKSIGTMCLNFTTLFDNNYILHGISLYKSLLAQNIKFHFYVLCFDSDCKNNLDLLNYDFLTTISLNEFEDDELLSIKYSRTRVEYCWTCSASLILYCINKFNLDHCTYLDADVYFLNSPSFLFEEMGDCSVAITSHNYDPVYDKSITSGKFCVQYVTFKNESNSIALLEQWRNQCIEWCYSRYENGKFGDQLYLDSWENLSYVHIIKEKGAGLAPWNVAQFTVDQENIRFRKKDNIKPIFYHFHGFKMFNKSSFVYSMDYYLPKWVVDSYYNLYTKDILDLHVALKKIDGIKLPQLKDFYKKWDLFKIYFLKFKSTARVIYIILFTKNRYNLKFDHHFYNCVHIKRFVDA